MKNKKIILCFDIDNVLCFTNKNNYEFSKPNLKAINLVNHLYRKGYYIKIFTARFMGRNNENLKKAKLQGYKFTKKQLDKWGLNYHKLIFGKPSYHIFVDDKCLGFKKNWTINFENNIKKL